MMISSTGKVVTNHRDGDDELAMNMEQDFSTKKRCRKFSKHKPCEYSNKSETPKQLVHQLMNRSITNDFFTNEHNNFKN